MARVKERRRRQRIDVALVTKIEYNKKKIKTQTKNISLLGIYLQNDKEIPIATALDIAIKIPKTKKNKSRQIHCKGVVFRCRPIASFKPKSQYGIGIFFRSFLEKAEKELSGYIDYVLLQEKRKGEIYMRKREKKRAKQKGGKR